jgi:hypothetical protein
MKRAALTILSTLAVATGVAPAHGADDPLTQLRTCSLMQREDRLQCLDKLARIVAPPARPAQTANEWIISQTISPVDYPDRQRRNLVARGCGRLTAAALRTLPGRT